MSRLSLHRLASAAGLVCLASACAPPGTLPPPVPLAAGERVSLAVGAGALDSVGAARPRPPASDLGFAQASVSFRVKERLQLSVVASGSGQAHLLAAGVLARYRLSGEPDGSGLALQLEGGLFWGGVGLAWRRELGPVWLYTAPSLLIKDSPWVRLPAGVQLRPTERVSLALETGLTTSTARLRADHPYGPMALAYIGASVGLGLGRR